MHAPSAPDASSHQTIDPASGSLVSVIVRSMDRPGLEAALASIAAQDHAPIEVVLVNARGPGHGPVPSHAGPHPVRLIDHGRALARSAAANAGLDASRGQALIFLDDDDTYLPGHVSRLFSRLRSEPGAVAAFADVELGRETAEGWQPEHRFASEFEPLRLRFENYLPLHAVMVDWQRAEVRRCRFDEQLDLFEDWDWWLQLSAHGPFVHVPGTSARYHAQPGAGSGVFEPSEAALRMRKYLIQKWQSRCSAEDHVALIDALQRNYRDAHQGRSQLAMAQLTEKNLLLAQQDLRRIVAERERELSDASAQLSDYRALVCAREQELAEALRYVEGLRMMLAAKDPQRASSANHSRHEPASPDTSAAPDPATAQAGRDARSVATTSVVFTIVSRNYMHFALNLLESVAQHMPGSRRVVVVCDALGGLPAMPQGIELLSIDDLGIEHLDRMVVQYSILELNTAIKPSAFACLLNQPGVERVIYFDPDIQLYSDGKPLLKALDTAEVVLTPHLIAPLTDAHHPSDLSILQSGTYNLGFLALRSTEHTKAMVQWWQGKLARDCVVDIPRGLFTDQKWMDLVPGLFPRVHIERAPGWNLAYWNLAHRDVQGTAATGFLVNSQPLFFFHFSGYHPGSDSISKHQDRFTLGRCSPAVRELFADYDRAVASHGRAQFAHLPYAFATLADGTRVPDCARQALRIGLDWSRALPDLRSIEGAGFMRRFLTEPVDQVQPPITRLALQLHASRPDLIAAFPDVLGAQREAFLAWFHDRAGEEAGIDGALLGTAPTSAQAAAPTAEVASRATLSARGYRWLYRQLWSARHLLHPLTTPAMRQHLRKLLVRKAFPRQATGQARNHGGPHAVAPREPGLTLIGYLHAESGVGESARATLRALAFSQVPHNVHDFRDGNVSRMTETVEALTGARHGIRLFHINADQLPLARVKLGEAWFEGCYRIAFWAWELEQFPAEWDASFDHVDEVWVPSTFCQRAIAERSPVPVVCIPHSVAVPAQLRPDRAQFGLPEAAVVFLAMADVLSSPERKNPFAAIEAFELAFGRDAGKQVQLVVKVSNGDRDPHAMQRLRDLAARCAGVHLIEGYLDRPTLNSLIDSVDGLVSLHRSEGFGLVIAEAMARGKLVIATGWSGNMDFMHERNSVPVDYVLTPLSADIGPYRKGQYWAEPDLQMAARQLRRAVDDPEWRQRLGQQARADVLARLAPQVVAEAIDARLSIITRRLAREPNPGSPG